MAASEPLLKDCTPHAQQRNLLKDYFDEKELKFRHVSAEQFADVWIRYDRDGTHRTILLQSNLHHNAFVFLFGRVIYNTLMLYFSLEVF
ncbi:unnamed protein product [Hydatigera taeniaeformis]|uniref:Uncharacterized protein n=1 Tax=Hydatigena taeniaeformis TaxID=6205 RepID=A0A0R3WQB8_HYDTA|nr:unnamed protein product [Hydatigera taeniaeformis]